MLGLGSSLSSTSATTSWAPSDAARYPALWFRNNQGIVSDESGDGTSYSPVRTSELGNLSDEDKINEWVGVGNTGKTFHQETAADKPRFETDAADFGSLAFPSAAKFMNLVDAEGSATNINLTGAFTILVRCKPTDFTNSNAILGSNDEEFLRFGAGSGNLDDSIRLKIDNNAVSFTESSNTFSTSEYVTLIVTRNTSNQCNVFVYSNTYKTTASGTAWGTANQQPGGSATLLTKTINNLGCDDDDATNFTGFISDLVVWELELTAAERALAFAYVHK